ncbi:flagellar assembly protein FliH [Hydrogenophaga sp.]|uniref:FliH/SctL family protein n=1 Tax=Hydrogenophaga sp. TaxID=1904254 RepID=UPI0026016C6F|nr:flagellar assembly protein FliH [Hydrogenophaga sp.]MCW5654306.1 flagellar assembly protein FliH [Hydrogenophaga sp.]
MAAWHFSAVDGSEASGPASGTEHEGVTTEVLQQARQQAHAEGFMRGRDAGAQEVRDALEATLRKTAEETGVRMALLLRNSREQLKKSEEQISRHILELACDIARQVVRRELQGDPAPLKPVIAEALAQLIEDSQPATVRMHPGDLTLMKGALQETLGNPPPEFVADPEVSPGGCLIESASMTVDATIEKRWARSVGNLGLDMPWNAGTTANPEDADV